MFLNQRGLNYSQVFALESVLAVALFALEVPSGPWADRFDRRKLLILGNLLNLAATALYGFSHGFWMFAASYAISGMGIAILSGTDSAYIYDLLKSLKHEQDSTRVFGWLNTAEKAALLVALPVGSLIASFGLVWPVYATLVTSVAGSLLLFFLPPQRVRPAEGVERTNGILKRDWAIIHESVHLILKTPLLIFLGLVGPAVWVIVNGFSYLNQPLFLRAHIPISQFGLVMGAGTLLSLVGPMLAARVQQKLGTIGPILIGSALMAAAFFGLAFANSIVVIALLIGLLYGSRALRAPIMSSAANTLVPSEIRATTLSVLNMLGTVLTVVLNPVIGYLADRSLTVSLLFSGFMILTLTFAYYPALVRLQMQNVHGESLRVPSE